MTINRIIAELITSDGIRRIIIPGLGAFIKRGEGELVFVDILIVDDGVLTGEVSRQKAIPMAEAEEMVAEYVAAVKSELNKARAVSIEGVGTISANSKGLIFISKTTDIEVFAKNAPSVSHKGPSDVLHKSADTSCELSAAPQEPPHDVLREVSQVTTQEVPQEATSAALQPEKLYVPRIHIRQQTKKRKRPDAVMIIAILALLTAAAAIVYGLLTENQLPIIN